MRVEIGKFLAFERDGVLEEDAPSSTQPIFWSFICTSLDQWFAKARTQVSR